MKLLVFNLATDTEHPVLGFTTQWINALAERATSIDVITMRSGRIDVPGNVRVHSVGAERGWSEPRRVVEFYRHLFGILSRKKIDGCFSHMAPEFSILAGPVLRAMRVPLVTWYAHPSLHWRVKLSHLFSNRIVTSLPNAYPYRKDKVAVIGQAIDTTLFRPDATRAEPGLVLCAGRISRVKDHATLLRAAALLPDSVRLIILGEPDPECLADLRNLTRELGLGGRIFFEPGVPRSQLPDWYRRCAIHVNLTPAGFGDKVAWEAMACGRPCLVANSDFVETLGRHASSLLFKQGDERDLAAKISSLLAMSDAGRDAIGLDLRANVERLHSLPRLAERILELLAEHSRTDPKPAAVGRRITEP